MLKCYLKPSKDLSVRRSISHSANLRKITQKLWLFKFCLWAIFGAQSEWFIKSLTQLSSEKPLKSSDFSNFVFEWFLELWVSDLFITHARIDRQSAGVMSHLKSSDFESHLKDFWFLVANVHKFWVNKQINCVGNFYHGSPYSMYLISSWKLLHDEISSHDLSKLSKYIT